MQKAFGALEIRDQAERAHRASARRHADHDARELVVFRRALAACKRRGGSRHASGKKIDGDEIRPRGRFDDRAAVVAGYALRVVEHAITPAASAAIAIAAARHIWPKYRVGTTGLGGNP